MTASVAAPAQTATLPQGSDHAGSQTTAQNGQTGSQTAAAPPLPATTHPPYPAGTSTSLGETIAALLSGPGVTRAHWGIAVTTLAGTPLYGLNEGQFFRPASVAKLFTTTAAMALLGPGSTVETTIDFPPPDSGGVVHGNLTFTGHGDANLSGRILPYPPPAATNTAPQSPPNPLRVVDELADSVVRAGVHHITGDIVASAWPWEPYPQGWGTDDLLWGYGAPVSTLSIDDNEVLLTITPGTGQATPATATLLPDVGYYRIDSRVRTTDGPQESVAIHRELGPGEGDRTLHIEGLIRLGHPYSTELAVDDPPYYAALALRHELEARGIPVDGAIRAPHEFAGNPDTFLHESRMPLGLPPQIARSTVGDCFHCAPSTVVNHISPPLSEDVTVTLKESLNLHAELMLRRLGSSFGDTLDENNSTFAQGARVVRQYLVNAGLDPNDFVFYDGSGLSVKDLVTPRVTAQLLAYAATQPWFAQWKAALPIGGVDGTLRSRFTRPPLQGHIFAKTGTLGESRALAGYLDAASGRQVIVAIFSDNHSPGSAADRAVMDKIVAAIAAAE